MSADNYKLAFTELVTYAIAMGVTNKKDIQQLVSQQIGRPLSREYLSKKNYSPLYTHTPDDHEKFKITAQGIKRLKTILEME